MTTVRAIVKSMKNRTSVAKRSSDESLLNESPRSKGQNSRDAILQTAAQLATTKGLRSLSIGELAAHVGMSKSGLYAHFASKEELELATIEAALGIFDREVLQAMRKAAPGLAQLDAMIDGFLSHLDRRVFAGGCFFAAAAMELDTQPSRARDRVLEIQQMWMALLKQCLLDAHAQGEIQQICDVDQAVFEIEGALVAANLLFVLLNDVASLSRARQGAENVLIRLGAEAGRKKNATPKPEK